MAKEIYLPVEVRANILSCTPDISTLRNLVSSASIYHQTYLGAREVILLTVLQNQYGVSLVGEVLLVIAAEKLRPRKLGQAEGHEDRILCLLDIYRRDGLIHQLPTGQPDVGVSLTERPLSLEDCQRVIDFLAAVDWFVDRMARDLWYKAIPGTKHISTSLALSPLERNRLMRAVIRFQAYCNIFGARELSHVQQARLTRDKEEKLDFDSKAVCDMFSMLFPPWEFEEIASVHDYLSCAYRGHLQEARSRRVDERKASGEPHPWHRHGCSDDRRSDHLPLIGIEYFRKVTLQETTDCRDFTISCQLYAFECVTWKDIMHWMQRVQGIRVFPAELYYQRPYCNLPSMLDQAEVPTTKRPNSAWLWTHPYTTGHGFIPQVLTSDPLFKAEHRKWGYVFWDKERLCQDGVQISEESEREKCAWE